MDNGVKGDGGKDREVVVGEEERGVEGQDGVEGSKKRIRRER